MLAFCISKSQLIEFIAKEWIFSLLWHCILPRSSISAFGTECESLVDMLGPNRRHPVCGSQIRPLCLFFLLFSTLCRFPVIYLGVLPNEPFKKRVRCDLLLRMEASLRDGFHVRMP